MLSIGLNLLAPAARLHIARMARAIAPHAAELERRFRAALRRRGWDAARIDAFLAVTPAAASRCRTLGVFLERIRQNGLRLAKLNVAPEEVRGALAEFGALAAGALGGCFAPAREQLQLAAILALNDAYYEVREAETQAFFGLDRAEAQARGFDDLLRRFARVLARTLGARTGRLLVLERPAAGRLARPICIERGGRYERLVAAGVRSRCGSYWSYPLCPRAVVQLGFRARRKWLPRERALLDGAAQRCREAAEKEGLEEEVRRLEAEARRAEEQERRRIGRELHDEAGQALLLLRLELEMMEREAPPGMRRKLRRARGIAERTVADLRRIIAALSPAVLERLGLEAALRQLAGRFRSIHPAEVRLSVKAGDGRLPAEVQQVIYRVAQEALQNIAKHTRARRVNLWLGAADKVIRLRVSDNGAGFTTAAAGTRPMSFGLAGMRERAELLGGTLKVTSAPGKGTVLRLDLPLGARAVAKGAVASHGKNTGFID